MTDDSSARVPVSAATGGLIDIHSHLLPGLDDGCQDLQESLECVRRLIAAGFTGTICTPHTSPALFPAYNYRHVVALTAALQKKLDQARLAYRVWPGGELRITPDVMDWLTPDLVPRLADSRCVLMDTWEPQWPRWLPGVIEWFFAHGYQPILAHPERLPGIGQLREDALKDLERLGVWLQGNFASLTGQEGYEADQTVRHLLAAGRYRFLALDMHGPATLNDRLDGLHLAAAEFGPAVVTDLAGTRPRASLLTPPRAPENLIK